MNGILVVDKPQGPTSFDVVRQVRALLRVKKVGHTGTLDPLATGVLPLCLGDATRIAGYITESDKAYDATLKLGVTTDTLDAQGTVREVRPVPPLGRERLLEALEGFKGTRPQVPPMYSAVKVGGVRLYERARRGEVVDREAREVTVHELVLRDYGQDTLSLSVRASRGFFVRVLAEELGEALGCGAHLVSLRRTQSGPFGLDTAVTLEALERLWREGPEMVARRLVSLSDALSELPEVRVGAAQAERVGHGVPLEVTVAPGRVRVVGPDGALLAVGEVAPGGRLRYLRVLVSGG